MTEILQTQEVGSLAKPDWRVLSSQSLTDEHIAQAEHWAKRLDIDPDAISQALIFRQQLNPENAPIEARRANSIDVHNWAARFAVRLQEKAGLDIVYDGEQDRNEMYQYAVGRTGGFEWRGRVRAFDNRSYKKAACVDEPSIAGPWHTEEYDRLTQLTDKTIKVPITGAYTLAAWSYDEHYGGNRRDLVLGLARNVIRPNVEALIEAGAEWIQIDEPAATTVPEEVPLFVESFNESVKDLLGRFSLHICFSDYSLLFPYVERLENCDQFSLEFANRDSRSLGVDAASRPAYQILDRFSEHRPDIAIGLGVTSVHDDQIEPAQLVRDRILRVVDLMVDPTKIYPSPDCGLRTRSWDVAYDKLRATVEGTQLAREALG